MKLKWSVEKKGSIDILRLAGRFDANHPAELKNWLIQVSKGERPRLIVDCGEVQFIDTSAMGLLATSLRRIRHGQGEMALFNLARSVAIIFELTRMDEVFPLAADQEAALAAVCQMVSAP